jgi:hypothetical protein
VQLGFKKLFSHYFKLYISYTNGKHPHTNNEVIPSPTLAQLTLRFLIQYRGGNGFSELGRCSTSGEKPGRMTNTY